MQKNNIIKNRDIVIVGQQPWDVEIGSNCKNIALEFSKQNRVLYVNSALDRFTLLKDKNLPKIQKRLQVINHKSIKDKLRKSIHLNKLHYDKNSLNTILYSKMPIISSKNIPTIKVNDIKK